MDEQTSPAVQYRILPHSPETHVYRVWCSVAEPDPAGQLFRMPAWIPGSYMIRDFARNVLAIHALGASGKVRLTKTDKQSWLASPTDGPLTVVCDIYAWDLSVRAAHLDRTHGFFNGPCMFLEAVSHGGAPCTLEIMAPLGGKADAWRVATTMPVERVDGNGFGLYQAADYDELLDHPVEMGSWRSIGFEAGGVPHELVLTGAHRTDEARLQRDLARICAWQIGFFGAPAPFGRYLFLTMLVGQGYGGLEHRASTALLCSRDDLPAPAEPEQPGERYRQFLGLCSHEYFHSWNVKRIRPERFSPYQLQAETHTRLLWVFEGFTSYYDDLILLRSGVLERAAYLELLGRVISRVLRGPGRQLQSVAESSYDAWTRFYKQDENAANAIVSYYAKGALVALGLDLRIRLDSNGRHSLDDVMRYLWQEYGRTGRGVGEDEMPAVIKAATGLDLAASLLEWVDGTVDLPLAALLAEHGVALKLRAAESATDKGGKPAGGQTQTVCLGARLVGENGFARVQSVVTGSPACEAGLAAGDLLLALDGLRVGAEGLDATLNRYRPGQRVSLHAMRHDALLELQLVFGEPVLDTAWLEVVDESVADRWLRPDSPPLAVS